MADKEDYERTNAREWDLHYKENRSTRGGSSKQAAVASPEPWQEVKGGKKPQKAKQNASPQKWNKARAQRTDDKQHRPPPKLIVEADNEAQQSWRNREPPKGSIKIPEWLAVYDRSHEAIAHQHGAFVLSEHSKGTNGTMTFGIWGEDSAVAATKRAIDAWIADWKQSSGARSNRSSKFAKVASLTPNQRASAEKAWRREVKRQRFRQHPPLGSVFEAIGTFHWPQEYRAEEILGMSYEALDPLRMDCECYVVFVKERSMFQISGKAKDVQHGLLRLRRTCFQISARGLNPIRMYLPYWPNASTLPSHVYLKPYQYRESLPNGSIADAKGNMPLGEGTLSDETLVEAQTIYSREKLKKTLLDTLRRLHYYRGDIQLRIRLGAFLATQFRIPKEGFYELEEYENMTEESQFIGQVTQELGDKEMEQLALPALQSSNNLLQPEDAITVDLADVKPVYSATFTFADEAGDLCLSKSWSETRDTDAKSGSFDPISTKWTRLERDTGAPASLLDISLCDLNTGMAWQFDIQASQAVDESRLPKALMDFGRSVEVDQNTVLKQILTGTSMSFVKYKPYAVRLKHIQHRLSYRYHVRSPDRFVTDYTMDLTRFQDCTYPAPRAVSLVFAAEPTVFEARWSLNVYRTEWDTKLAQNESLKIGEVADWKDDVDTWFPEDPQNPQPESKGAGFEHLNEILKRIEKVMKEVKKDDLMGGMTVG